MYWARGQSCLARGPSLAPHQSVSICSPALAQSLLSLWALSLGLTGETDPLVTTSTILSREGQVPRQVWFSEVQVKW